MTTLPAGNCDAEGGRELMVSVDSTAVWAHQHAAGARRQPAPRGAIANDTKAAAARESLGRSLGGMSTEVHLAADRRCRPISRVITAGQRTDAPILEQVLADIRARRAQRRQRIRLGHVLADKGLFLPREPPHLCRRRIRRATNPSLPTRSDTAKLAAVEVAGDPCLTPTATGSATLPNWPQQAQAVLRHGHSL